MGSAAEKQKTRIAAWGNSDGVRIPRHVLKRAGLKTGDRIGVFVNTRGNIEIEREEARPEHRRVKPAPGITFESLFADYAQTDTAAEADPWPEWIAPCALGSSSARSMSRKGCCPDNSAMEGFFGRLKGDVLRARLGGREHRRVHGPG